jgi:hypothetical protein
MITVLVVVSGLVMFVPNPPQGLIALLVETKYANPNLSHGILHVPAVRHPLDVDSARGWTIDDGNYEILLQVPVRQPAPAGHLALDDFPELGQLTDSPGDAAVKPECRAGTCVDSKGRRLVATTVRFEGTWLTRSAQHCAKRWKFPVGSVKEATKSDFRRLSNPGMPKAGLAPRPLATALALETTIAKIEDIRFQIKRPDGSTITPKLELTSPETCKLWLSDQQQVCIVLEVENWEAAAAPIEPACAQEDPRTECRIDPHFAMFYDLIVKPPLQQDRWLPYVAEGSLVCPTLVDNMPAVRCPPGH